MASILLAVANETLGSVVSRLLEASGHVVLPIGRPLAVLTESKQAGWDLVLIDGSDLGRDVLVVLPGVSTGEWPIIGIGFEDLRLSRSLALPLDLRLLIRAVDDFTGQSVEALVLRPERRVAQANGREVRLTRIEFRLLEALMDNRPQEVSNAAAMAVIWGGSDAIGTPAPLRSHVRNLRLKLSQIGLTDSLRSRRGRGYSLLI